jgi:hypothetical protein
LSWLSTHPRVFLLPTNTQASFCDPAFHWLDPLSSQTIIIVSLNLQRIHYTSFHQIPPSSKRQYHKQRKRIFIVEPSLWLSMHPPVFLLPDTQASFCNLAFHWSDPQSSQTIIIVSLNLQRIHYTSFHQSHHHLGAAFQVPYSGVI